MIFPANAAAIINCTPDVEANCVATERAAALLPAIHAGVSAFGLENVMVHAVGTPAVTTITPRMSVEVEVIDAVPQVPSVGTLPFVTTSPTLLIAKGVLVPIPFVDEPIENSHCNAPLAFVVVELKIENRAKGVLVPTPTLPFAFTLNSDDVAVPFAEVEEATSNRGARLA